MEGYKIQYNVNRDSAGTVEFLAFSTHASLGKDNFKRLEKEFKKEDLYFDFEGVVKKYKVKQTGKLTIEQLEKDLLLFVERLKNAGFEPQLDKNV